MDKSKWEYKKLGEVCTIERGGSPRPIADYLTDDPLGINWIKIGDAVEGSKYISQTKEKIKPEGMKKSRFVYKGDFILSNSMSFGKPYILQVDGCIHDGWLVLHDNDKVFDKDFLYYYLSSPSTYNTFKKLAVGGVVNNLNSQLVRGVSVAIPTKKDQQRIVSELDCLNEMIAVKQEQLKEFDKLAQSIFYDMFGDPANNEKQWELKTLKDISNEKLSYGSGASAVIFDGRTRYIRITDINDNGELNDDIVSPSVFDEKYLLNDGDLLFARSGATVGKTYCHNNKYGQCIYAGYLIRLVPNKELVLPSYVYSYTKTPYYRSFIEAAQRAVAQPNINAKQYGDLLICVPPLSLQQQFADKISAIEAQKELVKQSIAETQQLLDYTMEKYFGYD